MVPTFDTKEIQCKISRSDKYLGLCSQRFTEWPHEKVCKQQQ